MLFHRKDKSTIGVMYYAYSKHPETCTGSSKAIYSSRAEPLPRLPKLLLASTNIAHLLMLYMPAKRLKICFSRSKLCSLSVYTWLVWFFSAQLSYFWSVNSLSVRVQSIGPPPPSQMQSVPPSPFFSGGGGDGGGGGGTTPGGRSRFGFVGSSRCSSSIKGRTRIWGGRIFLFHF
jgi:hypothetical protein